MKRCWNVFRFSISLWVGYLTSLNEIYKWCVYFCFTECDNGLFGRNCTSTCGKCVGAEQCHHINGTCLNGCDPGYKGADCTKGLLFKNLM